MPTQNEVQGQPSLPQWLSLKGRRALVTGASRGIGLAAASALSDLGAELIICGRDPDRLAAAAASLGAEAVQADVGTAQGVEAVLSAAGPVDILVSNAGGPPPSTPSETTDLEWQRGFDLTFMSTARLIRGVLPAMRNRRWGRIIVVTSLSVQRPVLQIPVSNAMRAAVTNHIRTLALEVSQHGITVNAVAPGYTETERFREVHKTDEARSARVDSIPASRLGQPAEVGAAVAYLSTPSAGFITGQEVLVDGGGNL